MAPLQSRSRRSSGASSKSRTDDTARSYRPTSGVEESQYDFCNAFWSNPNIKRDSYDGQEGFEALLKRMKVGTRTLEELRVLFKERASMEEDFAKKLNRLSKSALGTGEIGHLERAISQIKGEIELSGQAHADLASLLKKQDAQIGSFLAARESARKPPQLAVEKSFKTKREQREILNKAKARYEQDAVHLTGMNAHAALSQGRELDKISMKMDKIQQTVVVNERDYRKYVEVLGETTSSWVSQWKGFCDLCQDQEEDRLGFIKARLWDWANALSTVAMTEDESSERSRVALEQAQPAVDVQLFVRGARTGQDIPDSPAFVDYKVNAAPTPQTFKVARFPRQTTRGEGIKHSPSTVEDITRVFKTPPPVHEGQKKAERPRSTSPEKRQSTNLSAGVGLNGSSNHRPAFAPVTPSQSQSSAMVAPSSKSPSNPLANLENALQAFEQQSGRPGLEASHSSSSMFSPSRQNAASRVRGQGPESSSSQQPPTTQKQGQIPASMFKRRDSSGVMPSFPDPAVDSSPAPARYEPPTAPVSGPAGDDEEDDPLIRAINQLSTQPPPQSSGRPGSGVLPPGAVPLPGMAQRNSQGDVRQSTHGSQGSYQPQQHRPSLSQSTQDYANSPGPRPSSRNNSPNPTASHMRPPPQTTIPRAVDQYGQAFPGERSHSRPDSQHGSNNSRASQGPHGRQPSSDRPFAGAGPRSVSPQPFAGVGARGNSPGPQPFNPTAPTGAFGGPPGGQRAPSPHGYPNGAPARQDYQQPQSAYRNPQTQPQLAPVRAMSPLAFPTSGPPPGGQFRQGSPAQTYGQNFQHQQHPSQQLQSASGPTPTQQQYASSPNSGYHPAAGPRSASAQPQNWSTHPVAPPNGQPGQGYAPQQQARAPSPVPVRAPSPARAAPPPTGQFDEAGRPILFYVNAIYSYQAATPEEFSFSKGDVIAVTSTDPDGWWQGQPVGVPSSGTIFPSNFTEVSFDQIDPEETY